MDHLSARRQRLWEAMASCREGSDDLGDPQFADLAARLAEDAELRGQFQRLQEADRAIKTAFASVAVPAGLAARVAARLAEAGSNEQGARSREQGAGSKEQGASGSVPEASDCLATPAVTTSDSPAPLRRATSRFSRRRLLAGFTALSAAAALLAVVWIQTHPSRHETPDSVLDEAMDFFDQDNRPSHELGAPPAEYPMSRDIVRLQGVRWRYAEKFPGGPAVAYDLPTMGGRATLYVFHGNIPGLPSMPPTLPRSSTGGKSAAAWQAGETLYVLVVEGDAGMYSSYLDQSHGPLT
jgi:hypothetical protein